MSDKKLTSKRVMLQLFLERSNLKNPVTYSPKIRAMK